jgi:hypothetical protein
VVLSILGGTAVNILGGTAVNVVLASLLAAR